jgi:rare lipoprotein A
MRAIVVIVATLTVLALCAPARSSSWSRATVSAYSTADSPGTEGCTGRRLRDDTLTFASLIVPCGARVRFCVNGRCVTATRTDSGPYVAGRSFDLALGTVRALGFRSAREFGVRTVTWRRVG